MAKGILIAAMDFSAAPEDEFHDWYDLEAHPGAAAHQGLSQRAALDRRRQPEGVARDL